MKNETLKEQVENWISKQKFYLYIHTKDQNLRIETLRPIILVKVMED